MHYRSHHHHLDTSRTTDEESEIEEKVARTLRTCPHCKTRVSLDEQVSEAILINPRQKWSFVNNHLDVQMDPQLSAKEPLDRITERGK